MDPNDITRSYDNTRRSESITINPYYENWVEPRQITSEEAKAIVNAIQQRKTYSEYHDEKHGLKINNKKAMLDVIEKVIFNDPATIVIWADGTKTVVKCEGEKFDPEKGLAMAISKKLLGGNNGYYYDVFEKWLSKKEKHSKKAVVKAVKKVRDDFDKEQAKKNK